MNKSFKILAAGALALAAMLGNGVAQARDSVQWSVGINLPLDPYGATIGTTIGNARPVYVQPVPVYYAAPPVYYAPAPVYYAPAPVYYAPAPVYYRPAPVYYGPYRRTVVLPAPVYRAPHHAGWHRPGGPDGR